MYDLIKIPKINVKPAKTSETATKEAKKGLKPKKSIRFFGGNGNLDFPCIIKAIPKPKRNSNNEKKI